MTQPNNQQDAPIPLSEPRGSSPGQNQNQVNEETIFDGSPSWYGRFKAFAISWILSLLLVTVPIILQVNDVAIPWWVTGGAILLAVLIVLCQYAYHRTIRFRITNYRIDFERGLLTRQIDSLELWHADDLRFTQTLVERMMGLGSIEVVSDDPSTPRLHLRSISNARAIFDRVKSSVLNAKRQRGLLQLDQ